MKITPKFCSALLSFGSAGSIKITNPKFCSAHLRSSSLCVFNSAPNSVWLPSLISAQLSSAPLLCVFGSAPLMFEHRRLPSLYLIFKFQSNESISIYTI